MIGPVVSPSLNQKREIQSRENAYYWSGCFGAVLRKHGHVPASEYAQESCWPIHLRLSEEYQSLESGLWEGPVSEAVLKALRLKAESAEARVLDFYDAEKKYIGKLVYPQLRTRKIPSNKEEKTEPRVFESADLKWNNHKIRFQILTPSGGWAAVGFVRFEGEYVPVAISDGKRLVIGVPLFDLTCFAHTFPPLEDGYYDMLDSFSSDIVEKWILDQIASHAEGSGTAFFRINPWPDDFRSALTIRHDYDRLISDNDLNRLMNFYAAKNIKSTWGILLNSFSIPHAKTIVKYGHEIMIHSEARDLAAFEREAHGFLHLAGRAAQGITAHGGRGSAGYLGEKQFGWQLQQKMQYGELLGKPGLLPHPAFIVGSKGIPEPSALMLPPCHYSMDLGMKPEAHDYERLKPILARLLNEGAHVVLMNHPDIHQKEMGEMIASLDLRSTWPATFEEIMNWYKRVKYDVSVTEIDQSWRIEFETDLCHSVGLKKYRPNHKIETFVFESGKKSFLLPINFPAGIEL